jgi:CHASE3 domain sensor protein
VTLSLSRIFQFLLILVLSVAVAFPPSLYAQDHVVSSSDLRKDLQEASAAREKNLARVDHLFSSEQGQKALETAHVSYEQVDKAVRSLSDDDLARLSARAQHAQNDFAAGSISNRDLIWILIGVAVIILIIVAVR